VQSEYALAQDDENRFSRPARSLVHQAPLSVSPGTPLAEALAAMNRLRVGSIVVCDEAARPVGILTLKDVVAARDAGRDSTDHADCRRDVGRPGLTGSAAPVSDALLLMARRAIHHLPLVESGDSAG